MNDLSDLHLYMIYGLQIKLHRKTVEYTRKRSIWLASSWNEQNVIIPVLWINSTQHNIMSNENITPSTASHTTVITAETTKGTE